MPYCIPPYRKTQEYRACLVSIPRPAIAVSLLLPLREYFRGPGNRERRRDSNASENIEGIKSERDRCRSLSGEEITLARVP